MPSYPHRIRLRGPWDVVPLPESASLPPRHAKMPCRLADAGLAGYAGKVRLLRRFGFPGRIDSFERVWLVCDGFDGVARVALNDASLADNVRSRFAFEVTPLLQLRNQLEIDLEAANDQAGLRGEVALEIRCQAWLEDVAIERSEGSLFLSGRIVGECDRPLELYAIVDGKQALYRTLMPSAEGTSFRERLEFDGAKATVELVEVSTPWWTKEISI